MRGPTSGRSRRLAAALLPALAVAALGTPAGSAAAAPQPDHCSPAAVAAAAAPGAIEAAPDARVDRMVAAVFGEPGRDPRTRLAAGLLGRATDPATGGHLVVVDPARVDTAALQARLGATAVVRASCASAAALLRADAVLERRAWHPAAKTTAFQFVLDPATSRHTVSFDAADRAVGEALRATLGSLVDVRYGPAATGSGDAGVLAGNRVNDASPHFGGALIFRSGSSSFCTSGFSVVNVFGVQGSVTAGHCAGGSSAVSFESGANFYGVTTFVQHSTTRDMALLNGPFEAYSPTVYVDPGTITQRQVTGAGDPTVFNQPLCVSGAITRARCNVLFKTSNGGTACTKAPAPVICTRGLFTATRTDVVVAVEGDSGAPIYSQGAGTTATIRGMLVGGTADRHTIFGHLVSTIESTLGVRVLA